MKPPSDRLLQIDKEGGWDEYRLLVINLLNTIQTDQREMAASIQKISDNYVNMKLDITREITASTTRRTFMAACIPLGLSFATLLYNLFLTMKTGVPPLPKFGP